VVVAAVVAPHVAADTTPVAENAATRASTNREMAIFFIMIHLLYVTQVGAFALFCVILSLFTRYKKVVIALVCKLPINCNIERLVNLFWGALFEEDGAKRFGLSPSLFLS